jgi:flagellar biosynthetic protein FliR
VVPISQEWLTSNVTIFMLMSLRLFGCMLTMPLFAFRAHPLRVRLVFVLVLAFCLLPLASTKLPSVPVEEASIFTAMVEFAIGLAAGWAVRVGMMAFDIVAEVIALQTGLSFAANAYQDPNLASGITAELLGLVALAIAFALNIHLVFIDLIVRSFWVLPFGTWPTGWDWSSVLSLVTQAFAFGAVLSLPVIVVYLVINTAQAVLVRVSPQLNLFAIGFAISVPIAFLILSIVIPAFPEAVVRALEPVFAWLNSGLSKD